MENPLLEYWYFHLPNYLLAALMYTLIGRFLLTFLVPAGWNNYIWRGFVRLTDPVLRLFAFITPKTVPFMVLMAFSFLWLFVIRVAFLRVLAVYGLAPVAS